MLDQMKVLWFEFTSSLNSSHEDLRYLTDRKHAEGLFREFELWLFKKNNGFSVFEIEIEGRKVHKIEVYEDLDDLTFIDDLIEFFDFSPETIITLPYTKIIPIGNYLLFHCTLVEL